MTALHDKPDLFILSSRLGLLVLALAGCGGPVDPCANVPCSEGRVCVVRSVGKVACEVPDAGMP